MTKRIYLPTLLVGHLLLSGCATVPGEDVKPSFSGTVTLAARYLPGGSTIELALTVEDNQLVTGVRTDTRPVREESGWTNDVVENPKTFSSPFDQRKFAAILALGILELPTQTDLPEDGVGFILDGVRYAIEIRHDDTYKLIQYSNPQCHPRREDQTIVRIFQLARQLIDPRKRATK